MSSATELPIWVQLGPGLHRGITDHQYHLECNTLASQSVLKPLANGKSPAHVRDKMVNPTPSTPAMQLGSAFHALLLCNGWHQRVYQAPSNDRRTKMYKELAESIAGSMPADGMIMTPDEVEQLKDMVCAVRNCHAAFWPIKTAIENPAENYIEAMGLWKVITDQDINTNVPQAGDAEWPIWCKFKPDVFLPERGIVVDIKTTQDAERKEFEKSIFNFGYHLQAGFYFEGLRRLGFEPDLYLIVAVEKEPPYGVKVYNLDPDVIDFGWRDEDALALPADQSSSGDTR